jgi:hypothetical protein
MDLDLNTMELAGSLLSVPQGLLDDVVCRLGLVLGIVYESRAFAWIDLGQPSRFDRWQTGTGTYRGRLQGSMKWGPRIAR